MKGLWGRMGLRWLLPLFFPKQRCDTSLSTSGKNGTEIISAILSPMLLFFSFFFIPSFSLFVLFWFLIL